MTLYTPIVLGLPCNVFGQDLAKVIVSLVIQVRWGDIPRTLLACPQVSPLTYLWFPAEFVLLLLEKMQTQEILRMLRLPELADLGQFFRSLSATTLVSMGALAAILAYWFTHRPKALQPPCNLLMQSEEVEVRRMGVVELWKVVGRRQAS